MQSLLHGQKQPGLSCATGESMQAGHGWSKVRVRRSVLWHLNDVLQALHSTASHPFLNSPQYILSSKQIFWDMACSWSQGRPCIYEGEHLDGLQMPPADAGNLRRPRLARFQLRELHSPLGPSLPGSLLPGRSPCQAYFTDIEVISQLERWQLQRHRLRVGLPESQLPAVSNLHLHPSNVSLPAIRGSSGLVFIAQSPALPAQKLDVPSRFLEAYPEADWKLQAPH